MLFGKISNDYTKLCNNLKQKHKSYRKYGQTIKIVEEW